MSRLALILALTLGAGVASANDQPTWGLSLKTGPYKPDMGAAHDYYEIVYGSEKDSSLFKHRPLMTDLEGSWYLITEYGLFGPTFHAGVWGIAAPTRVCPTSPTGCSAADVTGGTSEAGNDTTKLAVFPVGAGLVYKLDLIKRYSFVPLMPYVSGGVDYYFWRNTVGGKVSRQVLDPVSGKTQRGAGGTWGYRATAGLSFNLDFLEPDAASRAKVTTGMTDSYIFIEYNRIWADGFGDKKRLDFSSTLIQVGVAVDFK